MRVALVHVSKEAWITRVDTILPGSAMQLARSPEEAARELHKEGYVKVCGFQGEEQQLLVYIEAIMAQTPVFIAPVFIAYIRELAQCAREGLELR